MKFTLLFTTLLVFIFSCNKKLPSGIIEQEKMEVLLWEQMRADAFTREFLSRDSSKIVETEQLKLQQKIFAKYDIDKETFYNSYAYYLNHTDLMKPLLDSIVSKNTRIKQEEFERKMRINTPVNFRNPFILPQPKQKITGYKLNGIIILPDSNLAADKKLRLLDSLSKKYPFIKKGNRAISFPINSEEDLK
jgi:Domain of unknown function (DUF4296)